MENIMESLLDIKNWESFAINYADASIISNMTVSLLCGLLLLFMVKTETATRERPWTIYLGLAFLGFFFQYIMRLSLLILSARAKQSASEDLYTKINFIGNDLFGIALCLLFLAAARVLLNKRDLIPRWMLILVLFDVITTLIIGLVPGGISYIESSILIGVTYSLISNSIISISLAHFGFSAYINTKFYKRSFGGFGGLLLTIVYAGIHLFTPFVPLLTKEKSELLLIINTSLTFVAVILKISLFAFAFLIVTLENKTLIKLRSKLRESINERKIFFSSEVIFRMINEIYDAKSVKLYIKVPPEKGDDKKNKAHIYSSPPQSKEKEYECDSIKNTPLPRLLKKLSQPQEGHQKSGNKNSFINWLSQNDNISQNDFDGILPIKYHGALIGCLEIERKNQQKFTYSAEQISRVLSEDISILLLFYRIQESLKVFSNKFNKLEDYLNKSSASLTFDELNRKFENIIQQVLSPLSTIFIADIGFVQSKLHKDINTDELLEGTDADSFVNYDCFITQKNNQLNIGQIFLEYEKGKDPLSKPSLGYFQAYRDVVGSIVTKSFLTSVEQKLNLTLRKLSLELTKKQTFDSWFDEIAKSLQEVELGSVILWHPEEQGFWRSKNSVKTEANKNLEEILTKRFPEPEVISNQLDSLRPTIFPEISENLIIGLKLPLKDESKVNDSKQMEAALFIEVMRKKFASEIEFDLPWSRFLKNFSRTAGKALNRIIFAKNLQKLQAERFENYIILSTAAQIGFVTHNLINSIESLGDGSRLLKLDVEELDINGSSKKTIMLRIEDIKKKFDELQLLTQGLRNIATLSFQTGSCFLLKSIQEAVKLNETKLEGNIELELKGTQDETAVINSSQIIHDIKVNLPASVIETTFNSLIKNSIDAIKCNDNLNRNGVSKGNGKYLIQIWLELDEGGKFINCFVKDNGLGIRPHIKETIFDMNVSTKVGKGGWGLFYTKKILDMNAGSIEIVNSDVGNTVFRVKLPVLRAETRAIKD